MPITTLPAMTVYHVRYRCKAYDLLYTALQMTHMYKNSHSLETGLNSLSSHVSIQIRLDAVCLYTKQTILIGCCRPWCLDVKDNKIAS